MILTTLATVVGIVVAGQPASQFCEHPSQCGPPGVCVSGLCRSGSDAARVEVLYTIAVPDPLVLVDSPWLRREAARLARELRRDLAWTGFYDLLPPHAVPEGCKSEGMSPTETRRVLWHFRGVWRVLRMSLEPAVDRDMGTYVLRTRLVEVERDAVVDLPEGNTIVRPGATRRVAARLANALVEYDTGVPGVVATRLAVAVKLRRGVKEIGVLDVDGRNFDLFTRTDTLNLSPAWGPNGSIGYMSYLRNNGDWVVDGRPLSTRPGLNTAGDWSPDGRLLALSINTDDNADIYILHGETGEIRHRLTSHPAVETSPTWSPDGRRIAFVSDRSGQPQIWIASLDGSTIQRVTQGGYASAPDWSPVGDTLVYTAMISSRSFAIYRRDLHTGSVTRLTPPGPSAEGPAFSPYGRYIAYVLRGRDIGAQLWMMHADGTKTRQVLTTSYPVLSPAWQR